MRLHLQVIELKKEIEEKENKIQELIDYLNLPKFGKIQSASPGINCDYVNVKDILDRLK